ncbi:hypothetical protein [Aeromonas diversa]|uniref:Lipoprotein n=1 Tax=Aeromonas diversa CDC 2478-85 TaxID=1268237 RepID=N9TYG7_9GAMM|nr:hypothetical protein [Aeromonas diversa]ENY71105.1 hypothetical protein G114_14961 [Aeromonas diversa CDC 2478-85]
MRGNLGWLLAALALGGCSSPFERMWSGLEQCRFDGLYLDPESGEPGNLALARYRPWKVEEGLAWFRVDEHYRDIPVSGFVVPASSFDVHLLFIPLPLEEARRQFRHYVGNDFSDVRPYRDGSAPLLTRNREDLETSVLDCTRPEEDDEDQ